jgi:hypothetical protein
VSAPAGGDLAELGVGVDEVAVGHADAPVGDRHHQLAARCEARRHDDLGLRGREARRVVQQLGEEVLQVVGRPARQHGLRHLVDHDALVALDLADGGPHGVDDRRRLGRPGGELAACQDEQVVAVAPHPCGQVVEPEEGGELL